MKNNIQLSEEIKNQIFDLFKPLLIKKPIVSKSDSIEENFESGYYTATLYCYVDRNAKYVEQKKKLEQLAYQNSDAETFDKNKEAYLDHWHRIENQHKNILQNTDSWENELAGQYPHIPESVMTKLISIASEEKEEYVNRYLYSIELIELVELAQKEQLIKAKV